MTKGSMLLWQVGSIVEVDGQLWRVASFSVERIGEADPDMDATEGDFLLSLVLVEPDPEETS